MVFDEEEEIIIIKEARFICSYIKKRNGIKRNNNDNKFVFFFERFTLF
jgi:hypothetical protein